MPTSSDISLRDFFAAAALTGMIANSHTFNVSHEKIAEHAFEIADRMLAERSKNLKEE